MKAYYKKPFDPDWKVENLDPQLLKYIEEEHFPGFYNLLQTREKEYFLKQLKILICSNRSGKDYPYLQHFTNEEWSVVRDPITNKCSKVTIERFLEQPVFAFLFAWFSIEPKAKKYCKEEFQKENDLQKSTLMFQEIASIARLARTHLDRVANSKNDHNHSSAFASVDTKVKLAKQFQRYLAQKDQDLKKEV